MEQEAAVGAVIGCSVCIIASWGNPPLVVLLAAIIGFSAGSVIGVLVWIASFELPDEPVIPPSPGDERPGRREAGRKCGMFGVCPGRQPFAVLADIRGRSRWRKLHAELRRRSMPARKGRVCP